MSPTWLWFDSEFMKLSEGAQRLFVERIPVQPHHRRGSGLWSMYT